MTVQAFAFILVAMSQCECSAVCRAQAGEGSRLRPYHVRKILFITGRRRAPPGKGTGMPELSRFYGIVVRMYFDDDQQHSSPHIHVYYGSMDASYSLQGKLLGGKIPPKQEKLLLAWIALHEQELQENWFLAISAPPYRFPCSTAWLLNSSPLFTAKLRFARANAVAPGRRCSFCHFFVCKNTDPPQSTGLRGTSFLENRRIEPSRRRQI